MKTLCLRSCALVLVLAHFAVAAEPGTPVDLRRAVPDDAFLAVYARHNPERDYQREYFEDLWRTVQETHVIERAVKIVTSRVSEQDLQKAKSLWTELREAAAPIDVKAILDAKEAAYAQRMKFPQAQHLIVLRLAPEAAATTEQGVKNLFNMAEKYSQGKLKVQTSQAGEAAVTTLALPPQAQISPTVARLGDVLLLSSSDELARLSLDMLAGGNKPSKFDDPRLKEALSRLPEFEDSLVFYDGKLQFDQLRALGDFIRREGAGNPGAEPAAEMVELVLDELTVLDYEVTVGYTEGNQNRSAALGKALPGAERKLLAKVFASGEPFENWQAWVPADALAYSLNTGANLHALYEWVMRTVEERFPEAKPALERFERFQAEHDVYLDRDILQAFSGEMVSVSLRPVTASLFGGNDSVLALRCHKPDRIRELLHRWFDELKELPFLKAQQFQVAPCKDLEGFEEVSALFLGLFGARPVIGFREGWMYLGSTRQAAQKVLATQAGQSPAVTESETFKRLNFEVEGPVDAISYTDLAENTRQIARALNQMGVMLPIVLSVAGQGADAESLKPVQEAVALLPSLAKIVDKFDFLRARISVMQMGDEPGTYTRRTATVVRPKTESPQPKTESGAPKAESKKPNTESKKPKAES